MIDLIKNILLYPFSLLWDLVYRVRRTMYNLGYFKSYGFKVPVIAVGNVTFGGTGKTPFTIWLSNLISEKSKKVLILTRGYKGKLEHQSGVISGADSFRFNPITFGDEPILLATKAKDASVVVGKNRSNNLKHYFPRIKPDAVLLDDGYQHLKLRRDLNIVLFDALLPLYKYKVAPSGYLREGLSSLKWADAVVLSRADQVDKSKLNALEIFLKKYLPEGIPFAHLSYMPTGLFNPNYEKILELEQIRGKKVVAMAAIGSPSSFFNLLEEMGAIIVDKAIYPDHYFYSENDVNSVLAKAAGKGAIVVTSEKDMVKIRRVSTDFEIYFVQVDLNFIKGKKQLEDLIDQTLF